MSKKIETQEEVKDVFAGFDFLDSKAPAAVKKVDSLETKVELKDDELSEAEIATLEAASKGDKPKAAAKVTKENTEEADDEQKKEPEATEENSITVFAKWLNEESILDLDEDEKVESEEDLKRVTTKTIKNGISKYKDSIPDDGKKFLEFIEDGGKPSDFHKYYYGEASFEDFNIESEENQKYVIKESLKLEGYSDEEITEELADIEDTAKLDKKASIHLKKLQKIEKENKASLLGIQKSHAKQVEEKRVADWQDFQKGLFDKESIGGFKLTQKAKENLWSYMTKVVDKKNGTTQYQIDAESNNDSRYMAAYLQMNKWNTTDLERMVESKKTSELKSKLGNFTDTRAKQKGAPNKIEKNDINDPFAAFEKLINK